MKVVSFSTDGDQIEFTATSTKEEYHALFRRYMRYLDALETSGESVDPIESLRNDEAFYDFIIPKIEEWLG